MGEGSGGRGGHVEDEQEEGEAHDLDGEERARTWPKRKNKRPTRGMKRGGGGREVVLELDVVGLAFNSLRLSTGGNSEVGFNVPQLLG